MNGLQAMGIAIMILSLTSLWFIYDRYSEVINNPFAWCPTTTTTSTTTTLQSCPRVATIIVNMTYDNESSVDKLIVSGYNRCLSDFAEINGGRFVIPTTTSTTTTILNTEYERGYEEGISWMMNNIVCPKGVCRC